MSIHEFKNYIATTKLTFSYKVVVLLVLIENVNHDGQVARERFIKAFRNFYIQRKQQNKIVERLSALPRSPLLNPEEVSDSQIWQILTRYPLQLLQDYVEINDGFIVVKSDIWADMSASDLVELREIAMQRIDDYYKHIK